jgi:hypothetical protein
MLSTSFVLHIIAQKYKAQTKQKAHFSSAREVRSLIHNTVM